MTIIATMPECKIIVYNETAEEQGKFLTNDFAMYGIPDYIYVRFQAKVHRQTGTLSVLYHNLQNEYEASCDDGGHDSHQGIGNSVGGCRCCH